MFNLFDVPNEQILSSFDSIIMLLNLCQYSEKKKCLIGTAILVLFNCLNSTISYSKNKNICLVLVL